jgi:hypothetical protein
MRLNAWRNPMAERVASIALLALAWMVCAATTLTERVDRDEHMYLAAAALATEHDIYEDFAFLQTPYSIGVYRAVSALSPGHWTLLPARIFKILLTAGMIGLLFAFLRRLGARPLLAAALVVLLYQDDLIREMSALARNYDLARACVLLALLILPLRADDPSSRIRLLAVGILASASIGFKLTYAPLALLLLVWPLVPHSVNRLHRVKWLAIGALAGLAPLVSVAIGVEPSVLHGNLIGYHFLNAEFHVAEGYEPYATVWDRTTRTIGTILSPEHRPLSATVAIALALNVARWSRPRNWVPGQRAIFVLCFLVAALVIAVVPRPVQASYFAPTFFGLTMVVAVAASRLTTGGAQTVLAFSVLSLIAVGTLRAPEAVDLLKAASDPNRWTGVVTHRSGNQLAALRAGPEPVVTTHPIFALEGGCTLYPELATGEFTWRVGALLGPERRRQLKVASAETLAEFLESRPARAVVTEIDGPWDQPLVDWAIAHGWNETILVDPEIRAWTP